MNQAAVIFLMAIICIWFFLKEFPYVEGLFIPAYAIKRKTLDLLFFIVATLAAIMAINSQTAQNIHQNYLTGGLNVWQTLILTSAALSTVIVLNYLHISASIILACIGALEGMHMATEGSFKLSGTPFIETTAAAVFCGVISAAVYFALRTYFRRSRTHLLKLAAYFRYGIIFTILLSAAVTGALLSGLLSGIASGTLEGKALGISIIGIITATMLIFRPAIKNKSDERAELCMEWSIRTVFAITLSVSLTLLLFALPCSPLSPVPLSPLPLIYAGILAVEIVRKRPLTESDNISRSLLGMILAPLIALICTFLLEKIADGDPAQGETLMYFTIMTILLLLVFCALAANYIASQRRQKAEMSRIMATQQQQLYENRKAIGDLEIRSMVSENQALHDALEMKRKETMNVALSLYEQKEYLEGLDSLVKELSKAESESRRSDIITELGNSIRHRLSFEQEVDSSYFYTQAEVLHKDFNLRLENAFPNLTSQEKRLATLLRLGFSSKYIATLMKINTKSVEIGRYRLRQKLGLEKGDNLVEFIKSI